MLVDTSSSLNVIPKMTLMKLIIEKAVMGLGALEVKAFDESWRTLIREVYLPIMIGPHTFTITFQVVDIHTTYNCLLGRLGSMLLEPSPQLFMKSSNLW